MKRILVTGGAGFLGSHLCEALLQEGNEVICLDNFSTGARQNISHLQSNEKFEVIRHNVVLPFYLEVDQIYNLACPASPGHYQSDPIQTMKTNVIGTLNALGLAKRIKARIFQASTSEIYGDPQPERQSETYWGHVNPIGIRSCYDEGKRCAESLFFDYRRQHDLSIRVARLFNTYGPRMAIDDGRVVSNFIVQALRGESLTVYGDGSQTRSFCFVDDTIAGIKRFMDAPDEVCGPLNIGNTVELPVIELARMIISLTNSASTIIYKKLPQDDPRRRRPDIDAATFLLDWKPRVVLEQGLKRTAQYFDDLLKSGRGK